MWSREGGSHKRRSSALPTPKIGPVEFVAAQKIDMPTTLRNRTCDFLEHRPWGGSATKRPAPKDASEPAPAPFESPPTKPPPFRPSAELTYEGTASSIEEDPSTPGLWTSLASLYLRSSSPIVAAPAPDAPMEEGPSATPSMAEMADPRAWWSAMNCTGPRKAPARPNAAAADNAFDLMYRLRSEEEALGARPSEPAVRALMASFEATAGQLVALGEAEKARDISHVFLPALLQRPEVAAVLRSAPPTPTDADGPPPLFGTATFTEVTTTTIATTTTTTQKRLELAPYATAPADEESPRSRRRSPTGCKTPGFVDSTASTSPAGALPSHPPAAAVATLPRPRAPAPAPPPRPPTALLPPPAQAPAASASNSTHPPSSASSTA